jgi:hypothetical protein
MLFRARRSLAATLGDDDGPDAPHETPDETPDEEVDRAHG